MSKQTAVNWFEQEFTKEPTEVNFLRLIEQAKALEKQQIIDAFDGHPLIARNSQNGEEYYQIVFNQK